MSWIQKLHETYKHAEARMDAEDDSTLLPKIGRAHV